MVTESLPPAPRLAENNSSGSRENLKIGALCMNDKNTRSPLTKGGDAGRNLAFINIRSYYIGAYFIFVQVFTTIYRIDI